MAIQPQNGDGNQNIDQHLEDLEDLLKQKDAELNRVKTEFSNIQEMIHCLKDEITQLEDSFDRITGTNDEAKNLIAEIKKNKEAMVRIAWIAELFTKAAKILVINLEGLAFVRSALEIYVNDLVKRVEEADCTPQPDSTLLTSMDGLKKAVAAVSSQIGDCLKKALKTVHLAVLVEVCLGDQETEGQTGIIQIIQEILDLISNENDRKSTIKFPREQCPKDFYEHIEEALEEARKILADIEDQSSQEEMKRNALDESIGTIKVSLCAAGKTEHCN